MESESYLYDMGKDSWFFAVSRFPEHKMVVVEVGRKQNVGYIS